MSDHGEISTAPGLAQDERGEEKGKRKKERRRRRRRGEREKGGGQEGEEEKKKLRKQEERGKKKEAESAPAGISILRSRRIDNIAKAMPPPAESPDRSR